MKESTNMFKTPPTVSAETFATPTKQIDFPLTPDSDLHRNTKTPLTLPTSRHQYSQSDTCSIFSNSPFSSPITPISPVCLTKPKPPNTSYISTVVISTNNNKTLGQVLPLSNVINELEMSTMIEECLINDHFLHGLQLTDILGKGSFSTVFNMTTDGVDVAIKIPNSFRSARQIMKEIVNMKIISNYLELNFLESHNIPLLHLFGFALFDKSKYSRIKIGETLPCLITPKLSLDLKNLIKAKTPSSGTELHIGSQLWWKLAKQLLSGLIIMKNCSLVHLDLKTSNILFDSSNNDFKICDFTSAGLSPDIEEEYHKLLSNDFFFDVTLQYSAPELIENPPVVPNYETDLYAAGLILLSAAIGEEPYADYLKSLNQYNSVIILRECIKKNKILDLIPLTKREIFQNNKEAYRLIKMILIDRCSIDTAYSMC